MHEANRLKRGTTSGPRQSAAIGGGTEHLVSASALHTALPTLDTIGSRVAVRRRSAAQPTQARASDMARIAGQLFPEELPVHR